MSGFNGQSQPPKMPDLGRGRLRKGNKKTEKSPDFRGFVNYNGKMLSISAWWEPAKQVNGQMLPEGFSLTVQDYQGEVAPGRQQQGYQQQAPQQGYAPQQMAPQQQYAPQQGYQPQQQYAQPQQPQYQPAPGYQPQQGGYQAAQGYQPQQPPVPQAQPPQQPQQQKMQVPQYPADSIPF